MLAWPSWECWKSRTLGILFGEELYCSRIKGKGQGGRELELDLELQTRCKLEGGKADKSGISFCFGKQLIEEEKSTKLTPNLTGIQLNMGFPLWLSW